MFLEVLINRILLIIKIDRAIYLVDQLLQILRKQLVEILENDFIIYKLYNLK